MLKKIFIVFGIFCLTFTYLCLTISKAAPVPVTDENLKESLKKLEESNSNEKNYKITVENKAIKMTTNGSSYIITYDLTNNPTFSYSVDVEQGMSYDDFKEKTDNLSAPMIGYAAVANIQGVEFEDAVAYVAMCVLQSAFSGNNNIDLSDSYMIVSDEVTVEGNDKAIKESEFGKHVMEYTNAMYKEKTSYKDTEGYNTFEWTTERKDVTDTSCKIVSTLKVDLDADFSKLKGLTSSLENSFAGLANGINNSSTTNELNAADVWTNKVAKENEAFETISNEYQNIANTLNSASIYTITGNNTTKNNNTANTANATKNSTNTVKTLPYAGGTENVVYIIGIAACIITIVICAIKRKDYKEIK